MRRRGGYLLAPVVLLLATVAAVAFLMSFEGSIGARMLGGEAEADAARYVARAGLARALWQLDQEECAGDFSVASTPLGQHSYSATVTAGSAPTVYSLTADQDAWIRNDQPDKNTDNAEMHIRFEGGNVEQALFRFDLSTLPAGAHVHTASAWFYLKTDKEHPDASQKPVCTEEEKTYLLNFASQYFKEPLTEADVVWTYSGVRPLYDDGAKSATAATREYVLKVDDAGAPLLNVFGGKITTYRKLAEAAMEKIVPFFPSAKGPWTAGVPLAGGDFPVDGVEAMIDGLKADYPFLDDFWARRLVRAYGTEAREMLGEAKTAEDLGENFGATITARELDRSMEVEWVRSAEDFVWRRTKLGLRIDQAQIDRIDGYIAGRREAA